MPQILLNLKCLFWKCYLHMIGMLRYIVDFKKSWKSAVCLKGPGKVHCMHR